MTPRKEGRLQKGRRLGQEALSRIQAGESGRPERWTALTDADCMSRIASGDSGAFAEIVRRYQDSIVNLVYRFVGDWDTALDLAQDAFLRVHRRATTFKPDGNARSWLFTVAVNIARDYLRRKPRIVFLDRFEGASDPERDRRGRRAGATPPEILEQEEARRLVQVAIGRMNDFQRTMLLLRDFEGLSYEEIAGVVGCEVGTVKSRIHRARKHFEETYRELTKEKK